jgi:hypothetical protein
MTKIEIIYKLNISIVEFAGSCKLMDKETFFSRLNDRWNTAENPEHLVLTARQFIFAYSTPGILLKIFFKQPNTSSHTILYEELVEKYKNKLQKGGKASSPYIPYNITLVKDISSLVNNFIELHRKLIAKFDRWKDDSLGNYVLPHPLPCKLTLREMMCFTILHIDHHHIAIKKLLTN